MNGWGRAARPSRFTVYCSRSSLLLACGTLPPLRGKIDVGRESYAIFVGGSGLGGDLYAVRADGGPAYQITYTTVAELRPALSPDGAEVAFFRGQSLRDSTPATLWVLNLLNGADRELRLPKDAGAPRARRLELRRQRVAGEDQQRPLPAWRLRRPSPMRGVSRLGNVPRRSRVSPCFWAIRFLPASFPVPKRKISASSPGTGRPGILAQAATDPVRWGNDSVAFFTGELLQIRPLAKGRPRLLHWSEVPARPRQVTYFQGSAARPPTPDQM